MILCLDAGHAGYSETGQYDCGAVGPNGLQEADITLLICKKIRRIAEADGHIVIMTRVDEDGMYELTPRASLANYMNADLFVSIHCNAFDDPDAHGTETFCTGNSEKGTTLANCIHKQMLGLGLADRGVKQADFTVLTLTEMPAVLVETAFISNPLEEKMLATDEFQTACACAIYRGIQNYINI